MNMPNMMPNMKKVSLKVVLEKYLAVVNGKAAQKEFIDLFVWGEPIHPGDGGDIGLAKDWCRRWLSRGIKLPCGDKLPYKIEK
jgi:hypothetical protein